jgi:hypothetical protein
MPIRIPQQWGRNGIIMESWKNDNRHPKTNVRKHAKENQQHSNMENFLIGTQKVAPELSKKTQKREKTGNCPRKNHGPLNDQTTYPLVIKQVTI